MTIDIELIRGWLTVHKENSLHKLEREFDPMVLRYEQGRLSALRGLEQLLANPKGETEGLRQEPEGSVEGSR